MRLRRASHPSSLGRPQMKVPRRQFLRLAVTASTLPLSSRFAIAQSYPTRPVHLLEGFGVGGPPAVVARCHVPYRCAQVFPALLTAEAQVYFGPLLSSIEYVRAGSFRALAVTTMARSPILPDVPALGETLPGYEASAWYGIGGPKRTPEEVIEKLNKEVNLSIADPKLQTRPANLGGTALGGPPAAFAKLIADEVK